MVFAAIPSDPEAALAALARFGDVPACAVEERIERSNDDDHRHLFSRPRVLPALEGRTDELLPFLEHPNRRVVLRASTLLCRSDGAQAPQRVRALALRFPCEPELRSIARAMGFDQPPLSEPKACGDVPPHLAAARTLSRWPADAALAKSLSSGDSRQLAPVLWELDALEPARAQAAVATLARIDTVAGILTTVRALAARSGERFLSEADALMRGLVGAQLDGLARSLHGNRATALCAVAGQASLSDLPLLRALVSQLSASEGGLEEAADVERRAPALTPFGRAWLEDTARRRHDWLQNRRKLDTLAENRDRPGLRAYLADDRNGLPDRLEAAASLALLGDARGLALWSSSEGLWPDEFAARRERLVAISHQAPPEVRAQAEALLASTWPARAK